MDSFSNPPAHGLNWTSPGRRPAPTHCREPPALSSFGPLPTAREPPPLTIPADPGIARFVHGSIHPRFDPSQRPRQVLHHEPQFDVRHGIGTKPAREPIPRLGPRFHRQSASPFQGSLGPDQAADHVDGGAHHSGGLLGGHAHVRRPGPLPGGGVFHDVLADAVRKRLVAGEQLEAHLGSEAGERRVEHDVLHDQRSLLAR